MNALSSISQLWSGLPTPGLQPAGKAAVTIPSAELGELKAGQALGSSPVSPNAESSFSGLLDNMVRDVNAKQGVAAQALQDLQSGQNVSLHQAMLAMEEASVSFQLMVEVRNRLLESYQELMRMQV